MRCALNKLLLAAALLATVAAAQESYSFPGRVLDKKPLDAAHSVALADTEKPGPGRWGLYIVSNQNNQELLALDAYSEGALAASPVLEAFGPNAAYLHFYSDYGIYYGSVKYIFDLSSSKPPTKIRYGLLGLTSVVRRNGKLDYSASFNQPGQIFQNGWHEQHAAIIVQPRDAGLPAYQIVNGAITPGQSAGEPRAMTGPGGEAVLVDNTTPPGQPHRPSTIFVDSKPFPAPIPTIGFYRRALPQKQAPGEMESDIGPFVQNGDKIWFTTTFYDGEGTSGIGAIGTFDISTRKYLMRYLPEIAPWSGSAILLDGDRLWIGLKRRPEGADIGGGLLRYNMHTGRVKTFAIPDVIFTVDRARDAIYCGTSHGLYMLRGDQITQLRFEPNESGQLVMIQRDVR
ncbi:MAG TPA: hypothetical protein VLW25_14145 [Bryobacteraceae bacterium]|nr:hypothetical protein [Bryobacteraceae bacterium]